MFFFFSLHGGCNESGTVLWIVRSLSTYDEKQRDGCCPKKYDAAFFSLHGGYNKSDAALDSLFSSSCMAKKIAPVLLLVDVRRYPKGNLCLRRTNTIDLDYHSLNSG